MKSNRYFALALALTGCANLIGLSDKEERHETLDGTVPKQDSSSDAVDPPKDISTDSTPSTCSATTCASICVDNKNESSHCGACNQACSSRQWCVNSDCACRPSLNLMCQGQCFDGNSDTQHCGKCGEFCQGLCNKGSCGNINGNCDSGFTKCSTGGNRAVCVNLDSSPIHCGSCGKTCATNELCVAGQCRRYRAAVGCNSCPCTGCAQQLAGSLCCADNARARAFCVVAPSCPTF